MPNPCCAQPSANRAKASPSLPSRGPRRQSGFTRWFWSAMAGSILRPRRLAGGQSFSSRRTWVATTSRGVIWQAGCRSPHSIVRPRKPGWTQSCSRGVYAPALQPRRQTPVASAHYSKHSNVAATLSFCRIKCPVEATAHGWIFLAGLPTR